ncbi:hypothetical protein BTA51_05115 [Hahella sp. CCB-MM4]|uniref:FliH/SctL family protein n=1 Tax=Hahella sp. (strain CCB-MM4) TaxID=1926491 RepID=UPI000BCEF666|nr:FliH/SctL family protein [Hahella sp. CCB-MM4]OZG74392.1 hypothetical protein BTA51_05115 [Hahella sp. CCB-MM4]
MVRLIDKGQWLAEIQGRRIPATDTDSYLSAAEFLETAERIHSQTLLDAERIKSEAYAKGYESGMEQARSQVYEGMLEVTNTIRGHLDNQHQQIVKLSLAILQKVLPRLSSEETVLGLLREALAELQDERQLQIFVRPEHLEFSEQWLSKWRQEHPDISRLEVFSDAELGPLGCRIESEFGILVVDPVQDIQDMTADIHRDIRRNG